MVATYIDTMNTTITFGKYKDCSIQRVYEKDLNYCIWLRNQSDLDEDVARFLENKFANGNDDGSYILNFGRYRGKSVKQVYAIDESYIQWLLTSKFANEKAPKLCTAIEELIQK
jgi:uncharacterized protein (DUF3820 family)